MTSFRKRETRGTETLGPLPLTHFESLNGLTCRSVILRLGLEFNSKRTFFTQYSSQNFRESLTTTLYNVFHHSRDSHRTKSTTGRRRGTRLLTTHNTDRDGKIS